MAALARIGIRRDPAATSPEKTTIVFLVILDGDLVMSPEHLGVASLAAVVRALGFSALIREIVIARAPALVEEMRQLQPALLGITMMSLNMASAKQVCAAVRTVSPQTLIVCGGPAATYGRRAILKHIPEVNLLAIGEGERTISALVQAVHLKRPLTACPGLVIRRSDGTFIDTGPVQLIDDLGALPYPARDQFEQHGRRLNYVRISTSRGCVAQCTFCSAPNVSNRMQRGKMWRSRTPQSVVDEVEHLVKTYQFRTFDFIDSTFEDPDGGKIGKGRISEIARLILDRGLEIFFNCCMRAENWADADVPVLRLLHKAGLEKVNIGIESGNDEELAHVWNKRATVADNARVIRLLRENDIYLAMGFIQFEPYSTMATLEANAAFLLENRCCHNLRRLTERLEVYPGTRIAERLRVEGLLDADFDATLHPFGYRFKNDGMGEIAKYFASLYNNDDFYEKAVITKESAVYRFEVFNIVLSTFVSRIRRKFWDVPGVPEEMAAFKEFVDQIRKDVAEFNYQFFLSTARAVLTGGIGPDRRARELGELERYFASRMVAIQSRQLQTGKRLTRMGLDLTTVRATGVRSSTRSRRGHHALANICS